MQEGINAFISGVAEAAPPRPYHMEVMMEGGGQDTLSENIS